MAHVADQCAEQLLLALEIGVEAAQCDAGTGGDAGDRRLVKAALAELRSGRFEQAPERLAAAAEFGVRSRATSVMDSGTSQWSRRVVAELR
jgi:hypothetical protein